MAAFTARQIMGDLERVGFPVQFGNTGGGVYCILADVVLHPYGVVGEVVISADGEWGMRDLDTPCESVTVGGCDLNGEHVVVMEAGWAQESTRMLTSDGTVADVLDYAYAVAKNVETASVFAADAAEAVRDTYIDANA